MPKKKGKKAKGKKGKKGKKKDKTTEPKEDPVKTAIANSHLWEGRLHASEKAKQDYRECARKLLQENENLQGQVAQAERDTVDVITFLKNEDIKKEDQIDKLHEIIRELKKEAKKQRQALVDDYTEQIHQLQGVLAEKSSEVKLMQSELKLVKEFRKKRAHMQKELDDIKEAVFQSEKQHNLTLSTMEQKFFQEKMRLQQEASKKIAELAEQAHTAAVSNLDETTRNVYKENVRLNEALEYHLNEGQQLSKLKEKLESENKELSDEKELNSLIVEEKVSESRKQQKQVKELSAKVISLESALTRMVNEFEEEKRRLTQKSQREAEQNKMEIARLQRTVELKNKEMNRVKKLAKHILDERSTLEQFFLESLEHVKNEIIRSRSQYQKDAQAAFNRRMIAAHAGQAEYPPIRTFRQGGISTNSVFDDMKQAESWAGFSGKVDISELTWEQRERVLRLLFAKMNGFKEKKQPRGMEVVPISMTKDTPLALPGISSQKTKLDSVQTNDEDRVKSVTFLTQSNIESTANSNALRETVVDTS